MNLIAERLFPDAILPKKVHSRSSGYDLFSHRFVSVYRDDQLEVLDSDYSKFDITLNPNDRVMIGTGFKICVDYKKTSMVNFCNEHDLTWELQVRPRSGTSWKRGLSVTNTPGTIDDGYTGEIFVLITNTSNIKQRIEIGERIAQIVPALVALPKLFEWTVGESSDGRGEGALNSTGKY